MKKKHPDLSTCSLLVRDFPSDLADCCFSASHEKVLTRAVLFCLRHYFTLLKQYSALKVKKQDLESDLDQVLSLWRLENELSQRREKVKKLLNDPNRFYLHGD